MEYYTNEILQSPAVPFGCDNEFECGFAAAAQEAWKPEKIAAEEVDANTKEIKKLVNNHKLLKKDDAGNIYLTGPGMDAIRRYMEAGDNSSLRAQQLQDLLAKLGLDMSLTYRQFHIKDGALRQNSLTNLPSNGGRLHLQIDVKPSGDGGWVVGSNVGRRARGQ